MSTRDRYKKVLRDLRHGLSRRELWIYMGWREIKSQYSRSVIGPFWLTLSMGMLISGLGALYSQILKVPIGEYLPQLTVGLIMWSLINGIITGCCNIFVVSGASLRQVKIPLSAFVFQFLWTQSLIFAHNFIIFIIIVIIFAIDFSWSIFLFIPGLALVLLNGFFVSLILAPLCARFRDVPMIVSSLMQVAFFMTPIIWSPDLMPERAWLLAGNPFFHFIEIVRDPLLGNPSSALNWASCIGITLALGLAATGFFARYRGRVVYWS